MERKMRPGIGITMGDPAGIGPEIAVKALGHKDIYDKSIPIIIGDFVAIKDSLGITGSSLAINRIDTPGEAKGLFGTIDLIDLGLLGQGSYEYKKVQKLTGEASFRYIVTAIELAMKDEIDAVITGPINKEAINLAGHHYSGHTEIFGDYTNTKNYAMLLTGGAFSVIHVTTHCSMRDACDRIKKDRVLRTIRLANEALILLGKRNPRIAVAGLNAHAGESGLFGLEEEREIIPAIDAAREEGINAEGPVPPDTVFVKATAGLYDVVVAMYHDQGHIPFKLAGFKLDAETNKYTSISGVNCTIGLPIIRVSVDHGTAFGKAGEGRANEESLLDAINTGILMAKNRIR